MAFIFAILILIVAIIIGLFWGFAESMATAPKYTNTPIYIIVIGVLLSIFVASTHWHWLPNIPHIGW